MQSASWPKPALRLGHILAVLVLTVQCCVLCRLAPAFEWQSQEAVERRRPNIVVILADDLGYGDTSVYGGWVKTPCLERMAAEGLKFTDFHANSSVCSPTRAAFLTGRYQQRVGIVDVIVGNRDTHGLPVSELTIPRLMKNAGYKTALFGKWHLGQQPEFNPIRHGFDEFIGYLLGAGDYHRHKDWFDGTEKKEQFGYTTHLITDNAVRFIRESKETPFFLLVAHEAVHLPFQTPDDTPENRKPVPKGEQWNPDRIRPKYKVMLEEMDKGIGQILDALVGEGIANETLVFFFSDNGAINAGDNSPFRGNKFSHYEGGHRVPAIAWWPGKITGATKTDELTIGTDLLPTFAELADAQLPEDRELDGVSLKDLFLHGTTLKARQLYFGYEPKLGTALRDGEWKMIISSKRGIELFDLSNDLAETNNVADQFPEKAETMRIAIENWKSMVGTESARRSQGEQK